MNEEERRSYFGWLRVELEDSTYEEAVFYFDAVIGSSVETPSREFAATVVKTQRDRTPAEEREHWRRRQEESRYHGD